MRISRGYLFGACHSTGVGHHHSYFSKYSKAGRAAGKVYVVAKGKALGNALTGRKLLAWALTRSDAFDVIVQECLFDFLWLVLNWKQGQKLSKLSAFNPVLIGLIAMEVTV